jgi:hypothetical protein
MEETAEIRRNPATPSITLKAGKDAIVDTEKLAADTRLLRAAEKGGTGAKLKAYAKLSGPGWLHPGGTDLQHMRVGP